MEEKAVSVVEEDESEWPSLKLDVSEAVIEEEETLVDGVEIAAEGVEEEAVSVVEEVRERMAEFEIGCQRGCNRRGGDVG